jgi:hypothetical protein
MDLKSHIYCSNIKFYDMSYYSFNHMTDNINYDRLNVLTSRSYSSNILSLDINYLLSSSSI